jgi:hypothetical protein
MRNAPSLHQRRSTGEKADLGGCRHVSGGRGSGTGIDPWVEGSPSLAHARSELADPSGARQLLL